MSESRTSITRTTTRLSWNSSIDDFWANCTNWWHFSSFTVVQWHLFTSLFILAFLSYLRDTVLLSFFFLLPISLPTPNPAFNTYTHTQSQAFCVPPHSQRRTEMSRSPLGPSCPPSRSPPWAAGSQVFPRVSGLGSDNPSLVHTVIAQGHLSTLFPAQTVRKTGNWRNADATGESRCNRHRDPFTWINIVLPAAARLTKQKKLEDY